MVDSARDWITKIFKTLQEVLSKRKQTDAAIIIIHMGIKRFKVVVRANAIGAQKKVTGYQF